MATSIPATTASTAPIAIIRRDIKAPSRPLLGDLTGSLLLGCDLVRRHVHLRLVQRRVDLTCLTTQRRHELLATRRARPPVRGGRRLAAARARELERAHAPAIPMLSD